MARRHSNARRLRWALLLIGVAVSWLVVLTGYQALKARTALEQVSADFQRLPAQLTSGDQAAARKTVADAQDRAREARDNLDGPGWWLAAHTPRLGPNVRAVQQVAGVSDRLASGVLPGVVSAAGTLQPDNLRPKNGRVDLAPIRKAAPEVVRAASRLSTEADLARAIDVDPLAPEIATPVEQLQDKINRADQLADRASRVVRLLPPMMGERGTRRYILVFQNNAEVRASGGLAGSFAQLSVTNGKLSLSRQGGARSIGIFADPVLPLSRAEQALFSDKMARLPQNTTATPDFRRTSGILRQMWKRHYGTRVDGVLSVDPIAVSYVLKGTGPVKAQDGRVLTAGNVADQLLRQVYARILDQDKQNLYFEAAARRVFSTLTSGVGNPRNVVTNLVRGASERRILVWSSRPREQRLIAPTAVGGVWPPPRSSTAPDLGVFLDSARPSKLEYYLDHTASVQSLSCRAERQRLRLRIRMHSRVRDPGALTTFVSPPNELFTKGTMAVNVYFSLPAGATLDRLVVDGTRQKANVAVLDGHTMVFRTVGLKPQQDQVLSVDLTTRAGQVDTSRLRVTPGVRSDGLGRVDASSCFGG